MSERDGVWIDPRDDDESDAGDPVEAGQKLLASLPRHTRETLTRVGRAVVGPSVPNPLARELARDGPRSRGMFYWRGEPCDFSSAKDRYNLVSALWDFESQQPHVEREVGDVLEAVYGKKGVCSQTLRTARLQRLKNLCFHVNRFFRDKGIALDVKRRGSKIWLAELA